MKTLRHYRTNCQFRRNSLAMIKTTLGEPKWKEDVIGQVASCSHSFNQCLEHNRNLLAPLCKNSQEGLSFPNKFTFVIGNEASDADSVISSLVYAFYKSKTAYTDEAYIPVVPIPREQLELRCEIVSLLQALRINLDHLHFVDEIDWKCVRKHHSTLSWILMDHNFLNNKHVYQAIESTSQSKEDVADVIEIIDHHKDQNKHLKALYRNVAFQGSRALVGSCCTLVAEQLSFTKYIPEQATMCEAGLLSTLLLSVVALDTINFDLSAKKATSRDVAMAEWLDTFSYASKDSLYEWLAEQKSNEEHWKRFSVQNCLDYDYKEFDINGTSGHRFGVSSVLISLAKVAEKCRAKDIFLAELKEFCCRNSIIFLVIMTVEREAKTRGVKREILFYEEGSTDYVKQCVNHLVIDKSNELSLLPLTDFQYQDTDHIRVLRQCNTTASRKQVVPLLEEALHSIAKYN
uniref:Uncharacterized protein AlNc14C51G3985 n=1 Tax=Albugo laibachii Nc14 TaxID=890382 RepID=F0WBD8_9STRA|nr:conserved hypothetical protein [Albugo laibachii Nc14]|eukprot:CCA18462.1 conserved hypothetical protein [Albugo laibachii Nc14]